MIPADRFLLDGDTGWLVFSEDNDEGHWFDLDRPCETCADQGGKHWVGLLRPIGNIAPIDARPCPACKGTGRHTFDIEVKCDCEDCPTTTCRRYRVSIVPGMVLPIIDTLPATGYQIHGARAVFSDPDWRGEWFIRTIRGDVDPLGSTLPSAAAPGMYAVRLAVRS